ncbi:hypothetical protein KUCAC02_019586, partial [Chaenocephalus aceratus]
RELKARSLSTLRHIPMLGLRPLELAMFSVVLQIVYLCRSQWRQSKGKWRGELEAGEKSSHGDAFRSVIEEGRLALQTNNCRRDGEGIMLLTSKEDGSVPVCE